jgi:hypothetical protein
MPYNDPGDKWFESKGVRPPERVPHMTDEERETRLAANRQSHHCQWHQKGPDIICDSAGYVHGRRIGTKLQLKGQTPEGLPILKAIVL